MFITSFQVSGVCIAARDISARNGLSNVNMSFKQHSPSLRSPVVAMADPGKYVVDRHINLPKNSCFSVASPAELLYILPGLVVCHSYIGCCSYLCSLAILHLTVWSS